MGELVSNEKYSEMLELQESVNAQLRKLFEDNRHLGRDRLSELLVNAIERIVDNLNGNGHKFGVPTMVATSITRTANRHIATDQRLAMESF